MKMDCPHGCGARVSLSTTTCPLCRKPTDALAVLAGPIRKRWHNFWGGQDKVFTSTCPHCKATFNLTADTCPNCRADVSAVALIIDYATPLLRFCIAARKKVENLTPFEAWVIRTSYFLVSLSVLGLLLSTAETKFVSGNGNWISAALSTAIYLGMSMLILTWIVPKNVGSVLARLKVLTKISLFLNYLSSIFAVMFITDHWRMRSWMLIGTFAISIVGLWFASIFINNWNRAGEFISGTYNQPPEDPAFRGRRKTHRPDQLS